MSGRLASRLFPNVEQIVSASPGGLGTYQRTVRRVTPTGIAATDVARVQAAIDEMAGVGEVYLTAGTFALNATLEVKSRLVIAHHPSAALVSSQTNGTGQTKCCYHASTTAGTTVAISSNVVVGGVTIAVANTATFPVGTVVAIGSGNRFSYYVVRARSVSSGAGNLTVERPILWSFLSASDTIAPVTSRVTNVVIAGNGATLSGTGDRAIELTGVVDTVVEGFVIDATAGFLSIVASLDVGSLRSTLRDLHIFGANAALGGAAIESAESCLLDHVEVYAATSTGGVAPGLFLADVMGSHARHCTSHKNGVGLEFNSGGGVAEGAKRSSISGCSLFANGSHGIQIINGALDIQIEATQSRWNGGNGLYVSNSATGIQAATSNFSNNSGNGIQLTSACSLTCVGVVLKDNALNGMDCSGDFVGVGLNIAGNLASHGIQFAGAGTAILSNSIIAPHTTTGVYATGIYSSATGRVKLANVTFTVSGTGTKVAVQHEAVAGIIELIECSTNGGSHGYYSGTAGSILRRGSNVDMAAATAPYTLQQANFGTFTLNGATNVDVGFTGAKAPDRLTFTRITDGGTPGIAPRHVSTTPGTKYVVVGVASDTSVYEWRAD